VVVPAALPSLRGGIMLALGFGWSMVIASEFLGQEVGLGNVINQAQYFGQTGIIALLGLYVLLCGSASYRFAGWSFGKLIKWAE
jgi:ABC-type nitrate/sulfonate/bicarbonate transport system permease component